LNLGETLGGGDLLDLDNFEVGNVEVFMAGWVEVVLVRRTLYLQGF